MTSTDRAPLLEVDGVSVRYDRVPVLEDVRWQATGGQLIGVCGANGSGKSTLLQTIVGVARPYAGAVRVAGRPFAEVPELVSYVPQRTAADPDFPITVREVVATGRLPLRRGLRWQGRRDRATVDEALDRLDLAALADRGLGELSGGQRQRTFLARALAQEAAILLLDEPFAAVDTRAEEDLWQRLAGLRDAGALVVVVHHDLAALARHADRLLLLAGRVVAEGRPEEVLTPGCLDAAYGLPARWTVTV